MTVIELEDNTVAINFNNQILSLYGANIATDPAYQGPGTYGLPTTSTGAGGIGQIIIGGTNNAYTTAPTFAVSDSGATGSGFVGVVNMKIATSALNAAGTGYAPGDTVTLTITGGTVQTKPIITVSTVKLISATIAAGGTGYGNAQTFNAVLVGGTGTPSQVNVTSNASGVITTVNSVSTAGSYSVSPGTAAVATTGGTGTGLTLNLVFGVNTYALTNAGLATVLGTAATQFSTSGSGTGLTLQTLTWSVASVSISAAGTNYSGTITGTFSAGNATAQVYPNAGNESEERLLTLIDLVQGFVASANSAEEVNIAKDLLFRMCARMNVGGVGGNLATIATNVQKAGVVRFANRKRNF